MSVQERHRHLHVLAGTAARQHGVIAYQQLRSAGCSEDQIQRLAEAAHLHRVFRGVYAVGHPKLSRRGRWMAAVLAAGDDAAISHVTAAQHWGVTRRRTTQIDVATPRRTRRLRGVRLHRLRDVQARRDALTSHEGIPITTITRTIIDLAEIMDAEELAFVIHESILRYTVDFDEIERVIAIHRSLRGRGVLRAALDMHRQGLAGARSNLERRVREYLVRRGFPRPRSGHVLHADDGDYEIDLAWPELRIWAEVDGDAVHARPATRRRDRIRDAAARRAGWTLIRIREADFDADPAAATAELRTLLRSRMARCPR